MSSSDISVSGSLSAVSQSVSIATTDMGTVAFEVSSSWSGSLIPEVSVDGSNWITATIFAIAGGSSATSVSANGAWQANVSGCLLFRLRAASFSSGSAFVVIRGSGTSSVLIANSSPGNSLSSTFSTLADISVSTLVQLGSLAAVSQGILVTAHPNNSAAIRVAGSNAGTTRGQPLAPGASFVFPVSNANVLYAIAESGTQTLCVASL